MMASSPHLMNEVRRPTFALKRRAAHYSRRRKGSQHRLVCSGKPGAPALAVDRVKTHQGRQRASAAQLRAGAVTQLSNNPIRIFHDVLLRIPARAVLPQPVRTLTPE